MLGRLTHWLRVRRALAREKKKERDRSPHWTSVRDNYLKEHAQCAACLSKDCLQVHHVHPFHLRPDLELEPSNFIALCMGKMECHLKIGHGGSFGTWNPHVRDQIRYFILSNAETVWKMAKLGRKKL